MAEDVEDAESTEVVDEGAEPKEIEGELSVEQLKSEVEKWKTFARKNEKSFKDLEKKVKQNDADLSEIQKLTNEVNELKAENFIQRKKGLLLSNGLTESAMKRISGETDEEIIADIEAYKKELGTSSTKPPIKPNPLQGVNKGLPKKSGLSRLFE